MDRLVQFNSERKSFKKANISITISKVRLTHLENEAKKHWPFFEKFNKSERIEFLLCVAENLMIHFGYPGMIKATDLPLDVMKKYEESLS